MSQRHLGWDQILPLEIWDKILQDINVIELIKFKTVSTSFRDIITATIEMKCKWYKQCQNEIPESFWNSLLKYQNDPEICYKDLDKCKRNSRIWNALYKSWIGWSTLTEKTSLTKTCVVFPDNVEPFFKDYGMLCSPAIYSIDVLNNTVAVGDGIGRTTLYDISNLNDKPFMQQQAMHGKISTVCLCSADDRLMVIGRCDHAPVTRYWDVKSQNLILRTPEHYFGTIVGANYEFFCTVQLCLRPKPHYVLNVERLGSAKRFELIHSHVIVLEPRENFFESIFMDGDKVVLITSNIGNKPERYKIHVIEPEDYYVRYLKPIDIPCHRVVILSPSFLFCFSAECQFLVSCSIAGRDWEYYDTRRDFHLKSPVRSVLYHSGLLIFGLKSGELCIIHIGDIVRAKTLNSEMMKNARRKIIKLDANPIQFVKVTEFDSNQYIVAATKYQLYIVKFY